MKKEMTIPLNCFIHHLPVSLFSSIFAIVYFVSVLLQMHYLYFMAASAANSFQAVFR